MKVQIILVAVIAALVQVEAHPASGFWGRLFGKKETPAEDTKLAIENEVTIENIKNRGDEIRNNISNKIKEARDNFENEAAIENIKNQGEEIRNNISKKINEARENVEKSVAENKKKADDSIAAVQDSIAERLENIMESGDGVQISISEQGDNLKKAGNGVQTFVFELLNRKPRSVEGTSESPAAVQAEEPEEVTSFWGKIWNYFPSWMKPANEHAVAAESVEEEVDVPLDDSEAEGLATYAPLVPPSAVPEGQGYDSSE